MEINGKEKITEMTTYYLQKAEENLPELNITEIIPDLDQTENSQNIYKTITNKTLFLGNALYEGKQKHANAFSQIWRGWKNKT